jgi:D-alanine--poly(phosphoribitol) ligase subunit 1
MIVSLLACLRANRPYVPVDLHTPPAAVTQIARLANAELILLHEPLDFDAEGRAVCTPEGLSRYEATSPKTYQNDLAYDIFTSGSTGVPKGVPISLDNLRNFADWIGGLPSLRDHRGVTVLNQASFSFDLSVADLYYAFCHGHTLVGLDSDTLREPDRLFHTLTANEVCVMVITPTFLQYCLLNRAFCEAALPSLKTVYCCGEPLSKKTADKLLRAFPEVTLLNAYGPTEATSAVCAAVITPEILAEGDPLPIGTPDACATDISMENGEIVLRGKSVFSGYLGHVAGGFFRENGTNAFRTGDRGFLRGGRLYCQGRLDRQIKWKGYRIELGDIEANLRRIDGVEDGTVVALRREDGTIRALKAFVVTNRPVTEEEIHRQLAERLPAYMLPRSIRRLDALPVTPNHKIDRNRLETL